jgi:hypothetical protein
MGKNEPKSTAVILCDPECIEEPQKPCPDKLSIKPN